jgi:PIN domain nuclease of toxin-antitoxin system
MRLLLDTHVFIWMDISPDKLSEKAKKVIADTENKLYLSLVSVWEMQIKTQLGKLHLENTLLKTIQAQRKTNGVEIATIELSHILALNGLADHHGDPFDRLLIAQTNTDSFTLLTDDNKIQQYNVSWLW